MPDFNSTDQAFRDQEQHEELVEIDEEGNVYRPGEAPRARGKKPTILRDPKAEYLPAEAIKLTLYRGRAFTVEIRP